VWDWLFTARPPHGQFVLIEFKDGRQMGGAFAKGSVDVGHGRLHRRCLDDRWDLSPGV
jgi:hypothetical protein